jgi:glycosyltransferase involved in cell wall biosynthesis
MILPTVFDMSRLIARADRCAPTGIDRFELHHADWFRHCLGRRAVFVETSRRGASIINRERAVELIDNVAASWQRRPGAEQSAFLEQLTSAIDGTAQPPKRRSADTRFRKIMRRAASLARFPASPAAGSILLHVSHARLEQTSAYAWLGQHRRSVFYVHDLIPLTHRQFTRDDEPDRHFRRMRTVFNHAALVLCNSKVTSRSLSRLSEEFALELPPTVIIQPGIDQIFLDFPQSQSVSTERPYFVSVGTLEGRKNHKLLLDVWRRLAARRGSDAPRLVIVGHRGWKNEEVLAELDQPQLFRGLVIETGGIDDSTLARLVAGAAALLAPSFAEGYDMPTCEALALGTPIIASNIETHREVLGVAATLISPTDARAWETAIDAHVRERRRVPNHYRPRRSWRHYFENLEFILSSSPLSETRIDGGTWPTHLFRSAPQSKLN